MHRGLVSLVCLLAFVSACAEKAPSPSADVPSIALSLSPPADMPSVPASTTASADVVAVPSVIGAAQADARRRIEASGLHVVVVGPDGSTGAGVLQQSPPAGWLLQPGELVRLALTVEGRSVPAADVQAAIDASGAAVGPAFFVLAVQPAGADDTKQPSCGTASCALVRLSDGQRGASAIVRLRPTIAVLDTGRQNLPDAPPRLMSYEEIVAAATSVPAVQARLGGRAFTSASAGGGTEPWCSGQPRYPGTFCDTVMLRPSGEPGDPFLVSVNWITGAAGLTAEGR
jgi:hypothetical protein